MLNVLKTDYYKAIRSTSFWVNTIIAAAIAGLYSFATFWSILRIYNDPDLIKMSGGKHPDLTNFFQLAPSCISVCALLILIFSIMFSDSDFTFGTIKNIATKGYPREFIYISKFLVLITYIIFVMAISFATAFITAQIVIGNKIPDFFKYDNNFLYNISKMLLENLAIMSLGVCFAFLFKSSALSLICGLGYLLGLPLALTYFINPKIHEIFKTDFTFDPYTLQGAFTDNDQLTRGVLVIAAYILITTIIGLITFKKRDIN